MNLGKALRSLTRRSSSPASFEGAATSYLSGRAGPTPELLTRSRALVAEADGLRDQGRCAEAAGLYQAALRVHPARNDLRVQMANMLKDSGSHERAAEVYRVALAFTRDDEICADILLQMGRALARAGRRAEAREAYWRCLGVVQGDRAGVATAELAALAGER